MRSNRQGFTLIELLIVVVIIGILAAIAIPKFGNTKEKAVVAAMRSDLRNLASVQETYWNTNQTYYGGVIPDLPNFQYQPSQGVTVTVVSATPAGWSASAAAAGTPPRPAPSSTGRPPPSRRPRSTLQSPAPDRDGSGPSFALRRRGLPSSDAGSIGPGRVPRHRAPDRAAIAAMQSAVFPVERGSEVPLPFVGCDRCTC